MSSPPEYASTIFINQAGCKQRRRPGPTILSGNGGQRVREMGKGASLCPHSPHGCAPAFTLGPGLLGCPTLMRKVIATSEAPAAVGPYSQAIAAGNTLYCAGQIPLDPVSNEIVSGGVAEQAKRVLENVGAVLKANGMDHGNVVKATVFMTDLAAFSEMNAVYGEFFHPPFPARSTVQVVALPRGAQVEIEVVAVS